MSNDGSFVGMFNLSSQAGVAAVLAAIRASQLSSAEKNELRDLVFAYTNGGGDASVRIALEQKLSAHAIAPVVPQRGGGAAPVLPFGTYRPTPNFKTPSFSSVTPPPAPQTSAVPPVTASPVPPSVSQEPRTSPVPPVNPPVVSQGAPVTPPVSTEVSRAAEAVPVITTPAPTPHVSIDASPEAVYLERIRQIKTAVNSKVGNPVNLVDINNAVGREYMNALLEAMKKLGSGAISEMDSVMQRLEAAFAAVEEAIKQHEQAKPLSPVMPPAKAGPTVAAPRVAQSQSPVSSTSAAVPAEEPEARSPQFAAVSNQVTDTELKTTPIDRVSPVPPRQSDMSARIPVVDVPLPPRPIAPTAVKDVPPVSGFEVAETLTPRPQSASLAQEPKLRTPNDLPEAAQVETGEAGDLLFTKEVDYGLDQLLSDWSLFKKSGLFGTGPKGREHPLFKKLADLQVPLLLAGRFEGSNQEIRQSITDYMNGWRYEQGIIYQPGETFERYLRRVIRHILDLQKKRRTP